MASLVGLLGAEVTWSDMRRRLADMRGSRWVEEAPPGVSVQGIAQAFYVVSDDEGRDGGACDPDGKF